MTKRLLIEDKMMTKMKTNRYVNSKWVREKVLSSKVGDIAADVIGRGEEKLNALLGKVKKKSKKKMTKEFDTSGITKTKRSS